MLTAQDDKQDESPVFISEHPFRLYGADMIVVATKPDVDNTFTDQEKAESYQNFRELEDETAYLVVRYEDKFYVIASGSKDDPRP